MMENQVEGGHGLYMMGCHSIVKCDTLYKWYERLLLGV